MTETVKLVRAALKTLDRIHAEVSDGLKPKVDARRAIVNAHLHDLTIGITTENDFGAPGMVLARRYARL